MVSYHVSIMVQKLDNNKNTQGVYAMVQPIKKTYIFMQKKDLMIQKYIKNYLLLLILWTS